MTCSMVFSEGSYIGTKKVCIVCGGKDIDCMNTTEVSATTIEAIDIFSCYMHLTGAPDIFCVYSGLGQGDLALVLG